MQHKKQSTNPSKLKFRIKHKIYLSYGKPSNHSTVVIVESPTKAEKLQSYLGSDYKAIIFKIQQLN